LQVDEGVGGALVAVEIAEQHSAADLPDVLLADLAATMRAVSVSLEIGVVDQDTTHHGFPVCGPDAAATMYQW